MPVAWQRSEARRSRKDHHTDIEKDQVIQEEASRRTGRRERRLT